MSIVTKTGDDGTTALMYGRRVSKSDARVEAYGAVDELNAALGVARAASGHALAREVVLSVQKDLVVLMGELATMPEDLARYRREGYQVVTEGMVSRLEDAIRDVEAGQAPLKGWATPGGSVESAALDLARTVGRRAERRVCDLREKCGQGNPQIVIYLNRLADLLWLLGRRTEKGEGGSEK